MIPGIGEILVFLWSVKIKDLSKKKKKKQNTHNNNTQNKTTPYIESIIYNGNYNHINNKKPWALLCCHLYKHYLLAGEARELLKIQGQLCGEKTLWSQNKFNIKITECKSVSNQYKKQM